MKNSFKGIQLDFDEDYIFRPLNDAVIDEIEQEINITFPKEVREFYKKFNGAQFGDEGNCIGNKESFQKLDMLAELNAIDRNLDFLELYEATLNEYWPKQLIPFAYDEGGREFCFSVSPDDYWGIYFHDAEQTGEQQEVQFLAKNFLSFLAALKPEAAFE